MHTIIQQSVEQCQKHAKSIYLSICLITCSIIIGYAIQTYQQSHHNAIADTFFELNRPNSAPDTEALEAYAEKHQGSIFSDLSRLKLAATYFNDDKNSMRAASTLEKIINSSSLEHMRSLAAYRLANMIKHEDPKKSLSLTEKIKTKSLRHLRALLRSELYRNQKDHAKAMLEINSLLSDIGMDNEPDNKLLIELATQEKRQLLNEQQQT